MEAQVTINTDRSSVSTADEFNKLTEGATSCEWEGGGNWDDFTVTLRDGSVARIHVHYQSLVFPAALDLFYSLNPQKTRRSWETRAPVSTPALNKGINAMSSNLQAWAKTRETATVDDLINALGRAHGNAKYFLGDHGSRTDDYKSAETKMRQAEWILGSVFGHNHTINGHRTGENAEIFEQFDAASDAEYDKVVSNFGPNARTRENNIRKETRLREMAAKN